MYICIKIITHQIVSNKTKTDIKKTVWGSKVELVHKVKIEKQYKRNHKKKTNTKHSCKRKKLNVHILNNNKQTQKNTQLYKKQNKRRTKKHKQNTHITKTTEQSY